MIMSLRSFENQAGMLAIMMMGSRDVFMTKLEIELAIEKFGNYAISNMIKGKEVIFHTDLPYHLYHEMKEWVMKRKKHLC